MSEPYPPKDHIEVSDHELNERLRQISDGMTSQEISDILGGSPFREEKLHDSYKLFWRFMKDVSSDLNESCEIYMAEFKDDRMTFGSILPGG